MPKLVVRHEARPSHMRLSAAALDLVADPTLRSEKRIVFDGADKHEHRRIGHTTNEVGVRAHDSVDVLMWIEPADVGEPAAAFRHASSTSRGTNVSDRLAGLIDW